MRYDDTPQFETVQDLINFLLQYPPDSKVLVFDNCAWECVPLVTAEYHNFKEIILYYE